LVWDKDRQLSADDPLRQVPTVVVCEPALHPTSGAVSLLFPVADAALDCADPLGLVAETRDLPLVYVGNQYDRDDVFDRYFTPAELHVVDGAAATRKIAELISIVGTSEHAELLRECLAKLTLFRLSRQLDIIERQLSHLLPGPVG